MYLVSSQNDRFGSAESTVLHQWQPIGDYLQTTEDRERFQPNTSKTTTHMYINFRYLIYFI